MVSTQILLCYFAYRSGEKMPLIKGEDVYQKVAPIAVFVLGLAESISSGAAGFWGGLPFWSICILVLPLVFYDLWNTCFRKR